MQIGAIQVLWKKEDDFYFCTWNVKCLFLLNKIEISFPNIPFVIHPVNHGPGIPVSFLPNTLKNNFDDLDSLSKCEIKDNLDEIHVPNINEPEICTETELNYFVSD